MQNVFICFTKSLHKYLKKSLQYILRVYNIHTWTAHCCHRTSGTGVKESKMTQINQLNKSLWRKVYGAYRSHQKSKQAHLIAHNAWVLSEWDDKYLPTLHELNNHMSVAHEQWLDALDLVRAHNKDIASGLALDMICSYATARTPQESLQTRLTNYRNDVGELWFEAAGGYNNPIYDINN